MDSAKPPLDAILTAANLKNEDLVAASTEQLTFKQVQKARTGRAITPNIQGKIMRALNTCSAEKRYGLRDLFPKSYGLSAEGGT